MKTPGNSYRWWVLFTVGLANFSATLDMSIVTVSFPRLTKVFNTDASVLVWLSIAFAISELGLLLTLARVGDTVGRKKVFMAGVVVYTFGLVFCTFSPNIGFLIAARVVQGAGAAMLMTVGSAIVVAVFPREQQGRAIGLFSVLVTVGLIAGPALGGVILDYLDWQGMFYTRIPVGIISILMAAFLIREQKDPNQKLKIDYAGAATLLLGMASLLLYLNIGDEIGYGSPLGIAMIAAGVLFLAAFIFIERRVSQPVLDLSLFKNRTFTMAGLTSIIQMSAGTMGPLLFPFLMINGLLLSSSTSGLLMAIIAVPPLLISPLSGWFSDRFGTRIPMIAATLFFTAALYLGSRLNLETQTIHIAFILLLFGTGMGAFQAPNQSAMIGSTPRSNLATTLGVANTLRLLGSATGTAVAGTLFTIKQAHRLAEYSAQNIGADMAERLAVTSAFHDVILIASIISMVSVIAAAFTSNNPSQPETVPETAAGTVE